ncbi:dihydromonapterin reductase [Veronia nyctiphanis]|uniref:Dihydromonapterin reductase n=1 Tax=Veronia nyctiphanis TaxID=1278244 RepID=A0A4Q0YMX0_9GAMM|nr:dihydromonapterin reductase [Veronia nyctiphanis]RXJ72240.1 dihydromonapterin reductase [Veronia nyctiphanis]
MGNPHILITGAGQRIGLSLAENFLEQGYQVIASYRTRRASIERLETRGAKCIQADFSSDDGIRSFIENVKSVTSSLRAIVHNASDWNAEKYADCPASLINDMMQVHVKAPYLINLALSASLDADNGSCADIIHMTDYVVQKGSHKHIAYAASKAALENLTLSFAQQLAPTVKVNSIAPALIMFNEGDDETYQKKALSKSLLGIAPGANEVVKAVNYLLESDYMTGQILKLDGGRALK